MKKMTAPERPPLLRQIAAKMAGDCARSIERATWSLDVLNRLCPDLEPGIERTSEVLTAAQILVWRLEELVDRVQDSVGIGVPVDEARADEALDELLEAEGWEHPGQVLSRPRPAFDDILVVCRERLRRAHGARREALEGVKAKLERSLRIEEGARRRRTRMVHEAFEGTEAA